MASKERELPATSLKIEATIIPHTVDGRHSAEIVLTDSRWPSELHVPRPAITVDLEKPFDPIAGSGELKLRRVFEKNLLDFAALGVVATMLQRSRAETAPESSPEPAPDPTDPPPPAFDLKAVLAAMEKAGIKVPPLTLPKPKA